MTVSMSAASYGILVNGNMYFAGTHTDDFEGFQQYLAHVQLNAGDYCQLCDAENQAVWAVDLNPASVAGFTRNGDRYEVSVSGCYDFYIKARSISRTNSISVPVATAARVLISVVKVAAEAAKVAMRKTTSTTTLSAGSTAQTTERLPTIRMRTSSCSWTAS